ncbi:MAG: RsmE family RNA methyltransferase [Candidatus Jorgensenbacteria bacterium]|nr:RsmE family RNA methyltransferase [Candidatus Jorgensenbacteria bacterium]
MTKVHRFIGNFNIKESVLRITDEEFVNQARYVLRLNVGEELMLSNGLGEEANAKILSYGNGYVEVEIEARSQNKNESEKSVTLFLSILKRENFEISAQKATEVGISRIVPVISSRTVKMNINKERIEKIIKEASEQSGRGIVPKMEGAVSLPDAILKAKENDLNIFFDKDGIVLDESVFKSSKNIGIFVGPEGGWTSEEIESAKEAGIIQVSLGALTLRAETAATIVSYLACR